MALRAIAGIVALSLTLGLGACTAQPPKPEAGTVSPELTFVGDAIRAEVNPNEALAVEIPGLGRITGPTGAFSGSGQLVVRLLNAETPVDSFVRANGPGVDVTFEGTELLSPLTVFFDDPAVGELVPGDVLPLVLHHPDGSPWEVLALDYTPDGVPYIITKDFSPNVLGWIDLPQFARDIGDDAATWLGGGVTSRGCDGGEPDWAFLNGDRQFAHLCAISNTDQSSGAVRAEVQVQSNRQYYQWVTVPAGNDYLWVADQPDFIRSVIGRITGHDPSREVLLPAGGWMTAGYQQTASYQTKEFRVYSDIWSTAFDVLGELYGLHDDKGGWATMLVLLATCDSFLTSGDGLKLIECALKAGAEALANPSKAVDAAMDVLGERAYAEAYASTVKGASTLLNWVGKAVKYVGLYLLGRKIFVRLLDWFQTATNKGIGVFALQLNALAPPAPNPAPQQPAPDAEPPAAPPVAAPPAPPPATTPHAWVTRSGGDITYHWENMPTGMWPEVDRFRCWRYTRTTHPGGWATDGCGQQTGFAGYPSGSGSLTFAGVGANDSFSIEPWKYGPWLNVGESWTG